MILRPGHLADREADEVGPIVVEPRSGIGDSTSSCPKHRYDHSAPRPKKSVVSSTKQSRLPSRSVQ